MSMTIKVIVDKVAKKVILKLVGRFDFNANREFQDSYDALFKHGEVESIDVDLMEVNYLDSSALGMLLLLRENAEPGAIKIALVNSQGPVRQILEVANFHKLFTVN